MRIHALCWGPEQRCQPFRKITQFGLATKCRQQKGCFLVQEQSSFTHTEQLRDGLTTISRTTLYDQCGGKSATVNALYIPQFAAPKHETRGKTFNRSFARTTVHFLLPRRARQTHFRSVFLRNIATYGSVSFVGGALSLSMPSGASEMEFSSKNFLARTWINSAPQQLATKSRPLLRFKK